MPDRPTPAKAPRTGVWSLAASYRWLALPPALALGVFFLWPIALVVLRSFTEPELGLGNYVRVVATGPYLQVLWLTVSTAFVVTLLCLVTSYPVAYVISSAEGLTLKIAIAMVIIPLWTSVVIRSYAWMVVFQRRGVINQALVGSGLTDGPVNFIPGTLAVHIGMVHIMLPFMILPLIANMRSIDRSLLSAATVLGATPLQGFLRIFLPLSMPGVMAGSALVFMMSLGFFITPALLGGPRHMMAAVLIEQQANSQLDWGLASALSTALLVITIAIYAIYVRISDRLDGGLSHAR